MGERNHKPTWNAIWRQWSTPKRILFATVAVVVVTVFSVLVTWKVMEATQFSDDPGADDIIYPPPPGREYDF